MVLLFAFTAAGAWRQSVLPRWLVQVLAVAAGRDVSPFIVQLLTFGGDCRRSSARRPHVRGYVLVATRGA